MVHLSFKNVTRQFLHILLVKERAKRKKFFLFFFFTKIQTRKRKLKIDSWKTSNVQCTISSGLLIEKIIIITTRQRVIVSNIFS